MSMLADKVKLTQYNKKIKKRCAITYLFVVTKEQKKENIFVTIRHREG